MQSLRNISTANGGDGDDHEGDDDDDEGDGNANLGGEDDHEDNYEGVDNFE